MTRLVKVEDRTEEQLVALTGLLRMALRMSCRRTLDPEEERFVWSRVRHIRADVLLRALEAMADRDKDIQNPVARIFERAGMIAEDDRQKADREERERERREMEALTPEQRAERKQRIEQIQAEWRAKQRAVLEAPDVNEERNRQVRELRKGAS